MMRQKKNHETKFKVHFSWVTSTFLKIKALVSRNSWATGCIGEVDFVQCKDVTDKIDLR